MTLLSRVFGPALSLPPSETHRIVVRRQLQVDMRDGAVLLADHYAPHTDVLLPTILIRSSYGRRGAGPYARLFAERGYQVLLQSVRGT